MGNRKIHATFGAHCFIHWSFLFYYFFHSIGDPVSIMPIQMTTPLHQESIVGILCLILLIVVAEKWFRLFLQWMTLVFAPEMRASTPMINLVPGSGKRRRRQYTRTKFQPARQCKSTEMDGEHNVCIGRGAGNKTVTSF